MTPTEYAQLPAGWVWVTFEDLLSEPLANGLSIKGSETPPGVPALKLNAMGERGFDWSKVRYLPIDWDKVLDLEIQEGDFFISRGNGSLALVGRGTSAQKPAQRVIFPDTMIRARIREPIRSTGWVQVLWSCPGVREQIEKRVKTTAGIWKISQSEIESIRLPLPPLSEQTRIVGEVEKQLTRLDAGVKALKRVQAQLKRYRASVLKTACEGRLVPTEAELARREKRDYEPADKLLTRILKERRARWEADQLAKMKAAGKLPKDDKWKAKYVEPSRPEVTNRTALPVGWTWASVEELAEVVRGASPRPAGDPRYFGGSVPWITVGALTADQSPYLSSVANTVTEEGKERSRFIHAGTLLLTNSGATLGVPKITNIGGCINDGIAALLGVDGVLKLYLYYFLLTLTDALRNIDQGAAQPNLNTSIIKAITVPLPPHAEQKRIVADIESRLSVYAANGQTVTACLARAVRLRQALLSKAFEGTLVAQDLNDEPAAKLLERISAAETNEPRAKQSRAKQATAVPKMKATR